MADDSQTSLEERLRRVEFRQLRMGDVEPRGLRIDGRWLAEHGSEPRVERVWQCLAPRLVHAPRGRFALVASACVAAAVFALGIWVGRASLPPSVVVAGGEKPSELLEAEPPRAPGVARPAGEPRAVPQVDHRGRPRVGSHLRSANVGRAPTAEYPVEPVLVQEEEPALVLVVPPPRWLTLANGGEYRLAFQAVDEAGGFDAVVSRASAEELMTLADVARAAGQPGRAVQALREVLARDASDPNAPVAAMLLGNLLQRAGDYAGASEAYALNRRLSPRGDFAEDALARQFDVALDKGDLARARSLSAQYETEFPEGRRLGEIREQLRRAESDAAAKAAPEAGKDGDKPGADERDGNPQQKSDGHEPQPGTEPREHAAGAADGKSSSDESAAND